MLTMFTILNSIFLMFASTLSVSFHLRHFFMKGHMT